MQRSSARVADGAPPPEVIDVLFLATRKLEHQPNDTERLRLLLKLNEGNFTPLIRSARLNCFKRSLPDESRAEEMEQHVAALMSREGQGRYARGDLFCFESHVLFLLFNEPSSHAAGMRAGIIYEAQAEEPLRKLDTFCQTVSQCLLEQKNGNGAGDQSSTTSELALWRPGGNSVHGGFGRFIAKLDADSLSTVVCRENDAERVRASELLDDDYTRLFLSRIKEAYAEGFPLNSAASETATHSQATADKLLSVGLLRREVIITCRKSGHILFSLPSADALAVMTISQAWCSVCSAAIADEKIEEVFAPTRLTSALLTDGAWLLNRLHATLRGYGIAESEIAVEPPAGDGEARMMARVCDEPFLIVMRDGDLTPAFARRAIGTKLETEARHLVIVVTGTVYEEGRKTLQNFARRIAEGGSDFEMITAVGANAAAAEMGRAFGRVSRKALAEQLCALDDSLGLNVTRLITARFQLLQRAEDSSHAQLSGPEEAHISAPKLLA